MGECFHFFRINLSVVKKILGYNFYYKENVVPGTPTVENHWNMERITAAMSSDTALSSFQPTLNAHNACLVGRVFQNVALVPHLKWARCRRVQVLRRRNHFPSSKARKRVN